MHADTTAARLARNLRALIDERDGGNATAAARRLNVPNSTLATLLAAARESPGIDLVAQIARGYGVSMESLIGEPERAAARIDTLAPFVRELHRAIAKLIEVSGAADPDAAAAVQRVLAARSRSPFLGGPGRRIPADEILGPVESGTPVPARRRRKGG